MFLTTNRQPAPWLTHQITGVKPMSQSHGIRKCKEEGCENEVTGHYATLYCHEHKLEKKPCPACGTVFQKERRAKQKFCSRRCVNLGRTAAARKGQTLGRLEYGR